MMPHVGDFIGPFRLRHPIGGGSMGEVWQASRDGSDATYAVKVLTAGLGDAEVLRPGFRTEIRAMCRLEHPNIVPVCDQGVWGPQRYPWLAMPFYEGGTLSRWRGRMSWAALSGIINQVLGGLGHAHSRGVIHRDLKPGNLLLDSRDAAVARVLLADFGIAAIGAADVDGAGTPAYMAPEQAAGGRDIGPWTDLYALGALAYTVLEGTPPFGKQPSPRRTAEIPELTRGRPPTWVHGWLTRMLDPRPAHRFQSAAEARRALDVAGDVAPPADVGPAPPRVPDPHIEYRGLGVLGLRSPNAPATRAERMMAWTALRATLSGHGSVGLLLEGAQAAAVARWLMAQAHEHAGATLLVASHGPVPGPVDGIRGMVLRSFLGVGQTRERLQERIARWCPPDLARSLADLVAGGGPDTWAGSLVRDDAIRGLLAHLRRSQPVVVWIRDAQWGAEALSFVQAMLETEGSPGVLFVVTYEASELLDKRGLSDVVAGLRRADGVVHVELKPPSQSVEADALQHQGDLAPALLAQISLEDTEPGFPVALVADLALRRVLARSPEGATLGRPRTLPTSYYELYQARWVELVERWAPDHRRGIELAAVFGTTIARDEWEAACQHAGIELPVLALRKMADLGLMAWRSADPGRISFTRPVIRDVILEATDRIALLHRFCADALVGDATALGRQGRHRLEAGQIEEALDLLLAAGVSAAQAGRADEARSVLHLRERFLPRSKVTRSDSRWSAGWPVLASIAMDLGEPDEAERWIDRVIRAAQVSGDVRLRAIALRDSGRLCWVRDADAGLALQVFGQALLDADAAGDQPLAAEIEGALGWMHVRSGSWQDAAYHLDRAHRVARAHDDARTAAASRWGLGEVAYRTGRLDEADVHLAAARDAYLVSGAIGVAGSLANTLGEVARARGDEAAARAYYEDARAQMRMVASHNDVYPTYNLAILDLERGDLDAAGARLDALLDRMQRSRPAVRTSRRWFEATIRLSRLPVDAHRKDWQAFDEDVREGIDGLPEQRGAAPELVAAVTQAVLLTQLAGQQQRSATAGALSDQLSTWGTAFA
jgi:tetratricopeptide (TPR) repeat protein